MNIENNGLNPVPAGDSTTLTAVEAEERWQQALASMRSRLEEWKKKGLTFYYDLGKLAHELRTRCDTYGVHTCEEMAAELGISRRTIADAVKFYEQKLIEQVNDGEVRPAAVHKEVKARNAKARATGSKKERRGGDRTFEPSQFTSFLAIESIIMSALKESAINVAEDLREVEKLGNDERQAIVPRIVKAHVGIIAAIKSLNVLKCKIENTGLVG